MKNFCLLPIFAACVLVVSCEKPQSEAEKNAQIEREVQQRLAAQQQADNQQKLAQQQADLDAREKALADKEAAANAAPASTATPRIVTRDEDQAASRGAISARDDSDSYETFYRKLEPYGEWRETADYGYVFQPRQAQSSRNWRPYTDGRWTYTDAGWTWVSGEPFGWATYHYGRWTRLQNVGWVWVPGEEWAPAWVSWRKGDQNVGWAPLPPEAHFERGTGIKKWADSYYDISADDYVFIPNEDIGSENLERDALPVDRNVTIVNQTTNVTDITYNNTTIVNQGPNFDELRGHSRRPLERMRLDRQRDLAQDANPQAVVRAGVISMVAPTFRPGSGQKPRNIGQPIGQAQVERNWTNNANQPEAERARAKMKSEATPPPNPPSKRFVRPTAVAAPAATAAPVATIVPTPATAVHPAMTPRILPSATRPPTPVVTVTPTHRTPPAVRATPVPTVVATATPVPTVAATPTPPRHVPTPTATVPPQVATPSPREDLRLTNEALRKAAEQRNEEKKERQATPEVQSTPVPVATAAPAEAGRPNERPHEQHERGDHRGKNLPATATPSP